MIQIIDAANAYRHRPLLRSFSALRYEVFIKKDNKQAVKGKGFGGERICHTQLNPGWDAKNRHDLPDELWTKIKIEFYKDAADAVFKALVE